MEYRSSLAGQHISGHIVAGVGSSHGVEIGGGSTGGLIQPASDDASAALNVRAKGASGILNLGTSTSGPTVIAGSSLAFTSTHVNINSSRVSLGSGASTTAISGLMRVRVDFTVPEIAANAASLGSTFTAVGLTTNAVTFFNTDALEAVLPHTVSISVRCSTADEGRLVFRNIAASTIGTGLSSAHGYLGWFTF